MYLVAMKTTIKILLSTFLLLSVACSSEHRVDPPISNNNTVPQDIMSLKDGNIWTYQVIDSNGKKLDQETWTMISIGIKTWNLKFKNSMRDYSRDMETFGFSTDGATINGANYYAVYNDTLYWTWSYNLDWITGGFAIYNKSAEHDSIDVGFFYPAYQTPSINFTIQQKTFGSVKIAYKYGNKEFANYYAPGVGLVKFTKPNGDSCYLKSYSLQQQ